MVWNRSQIETQGTMLGLRARCNKPLEKKCYECFKDAKTNCLSTWKAYEEQTFKIQKG